jgi:tetratricopeptide (TPR) repeat protein
MMNKYAVWFVALLAGLAPVAGRGQVGKPAVPLSVKEWIKGKPVEVQAGTNVFVIEIFTTSSSASRDSITNLNALQRRFKDRGVVVAGISDEPAETVKEFVARDGAAIEYAIGVDDRRKTSISYMKPVRQRSVPHVFVVGKDGLLLWHGHPLDGLEAVVDQITAGRYDPEPAAKADVARIQLEQYLTLARRNDPRAQAAGLRCLANWTNEVAPLCDLALAIATDRGLKQRDVQLATEALNQAEKMPPTNCTRVAATRGVLLFAAGNKEEGIAAARKALASAQGPKEKTYAEACLVNMERLVALASKQIDQYLVLARQNNPEAKAAGRKLLQGWSKDQGQLCELALKLLTDAKTTQRDFALADDALNQAQKLGPTNSTRVAVIRAVFLFETGKGQEALARAKTALASAEKPADKARAEACVRTITGLLEASRTNQPDPAAPKP